MTTIIEIPYSPADLVAKRADIELAFGTLTIGSGMATVDLTSPNEAHDPTRVRIIRRALEAFLTAHAGVRGIPFLLERECVVEVLPDGRRNYFITLDAAVATATAGTVDITMTDSSGRTVRDSRREREERELDLAVLMTRASLREPICTQMLSSYSTSLLDRDHVLARLYEIRDALVTHFGNEKSARGALTISSSDWARLGELANGLPLLQGRHRGKFDELRSATEVELGEARELAWSFVEKFARWVLDSAY